MLPDPRFMVGGLNASRFEDRMDTLARQRWSRPALNVAERLSLRHQRTTLVGAFQMMAAGRPSPAHRILREIEAANRSEADWAWRRLCTRHTLMRPIAGSIMLTCLIQTRFDIAVCQWLQGVLCSCFPEEAKFPREARTRYLGAYRLLDSLWTIYGELTPFHGPFCADGEQFFAQLGDKTNARELSVAADKWAYAPSVCLEFWRNMAAGKIQPRAKGDPA